MKITSKNIFPKKNWSFFFGFLFVILILFSWFYLKHTFNIHFDDEDDNFFLGKMFWENKKIYADLYFQHQPLTFILSAFIQKIFSPANIFMLVKRHREFMVFWSLIWGLLLFKRFGKIFVPVVIVYELTKIFLLGNLFLAESLVIYPLLYLIALLFLEKKPLSQKEIIFAGILIFFIFYNLLPLWPLLGILSLFFLFKSKQRKTFIMLATVFLLFTVFCFFNTSLSGYLKDTLIGNFLYCVPTTSNSTGTITPLKSLITPFLAIFATQTSTLLPVIKIISLTLIVFLVYFLFLKKYKLVLSVFLILGLANIRFVEPHQILYGIFHLLPWYALSIFFCVYLGRKILVEKNPQIIKIVTFVLLLLIISISFKQSLLFLFPKRDKTVDYQVNFSPYEDLSRIINNLKKTGDDLFITPDSSLLYWQTGIKLNNRFFYFYPWQYATPYMKEVISDLQKKPPRFFYCKDCSHTPFAEIIDSNYSPVVEGGKKLELYLKFYDVEHQSQLYQNSTGSNTDSQN